DQEKENSHQQHLPGKRLIIDHHPEKRIQRKADKSKVVKDQDTAQFMAVEPHKKLIHQEKQEYP
ncbi:hypothetical protein COLO4_02013, partial [Corchorus olitorius]